MALLEFYGRECPHCITMMPLIERLEKETGLKVEARETWHDAANAELLKKYDTGLCGGVPFFFNTDTNDAICGECGYDELLAWARGKPAADESPKP